MKTALRLLLTLSSIIFINCDCIPPREHKQMVVNEYGYSTDVYLVEVNQINEKDHSARVHILSAYKGEFSIHDEITVHYNPYCEPQINTLDTWIVYLSDNQEQLYVNECGLTRDIKRPTDNRIFKDLHLPHAENSLTESHLTLFDSINNYNINEAIKVEVQLLGKLRVQQN